MTRHTSTLRCGPHEAGIGGEDRSGEGAGTALAPAAPPIRLCARCRVVPLTASQRRYCSQTCRREPRPICARPGCRNRCRKLHAKYCSKSCTAIARGREFQAVRRRAGRASWLKHGLPAYLERLARLETDPAVSGSRSKAEAFSRGITRGVATAWAAVAMFYTRQGWAVPPALAQQMAAMNRRMAMATDLKGRAA